MDATGKISSNLEEKIKELEKERDSLYESLERETCDTINFLDGQKHVLLTVSVEDSQASKIQEQIRSLELQKEQEVDLIKTTYLNKIKNVYAQISLLAELISKE
jgi:hypothetical protein